MSITADPVAYRWDGVTIPDHPAQTKLGHTVARRVNGVETSTTGLAGLGQSLRERGIEPINVREKTSWNLSFDALWARFRGIKTEHRLAFFESVGFLHNLPLHRAIETCARRCQHPGYALAIAAVAHDVADGVPVDEAMKRHPDDFDHLQVAMVKAGREVGHIYPAFRNIGKMLDNLQRRQANIQDALRGPAGLMFLSAIGLVVMLTWFVPTMRELLTSLKVDMPWPTLLVLWLSDIARSPLTWAIVAAVAIGLGVGFRVMIQSPRFAVAYERWVLKIPRLGPLLEQQATARIARVLSVVTMDANSTRAVEMVVDMATTVRHRLALEQVADACRAGMGLDKAFASVDAFDPLFAQYLEVGTEGSKVPELCEKVAEFLERQVQRGMDELTSYIEPTLSTAVSVSFSLLSIALYMPYLSVLGSALSGGSAGGSL